MKKFKFLEHSADIKFQSYGKSIEEAFSNAAYALKKSIYSKMTKKRIEKQINVEAKDIEGLLYRFLEELIYLFDSEKFILSKIENIKINKNKLSAKVIGDTAEKYKIEMQIKAVTYNEMLIKEEKNKFILQVVLDI